MPIRPMPIKSDARPRRAGYRKRLRQPDAPTRATPRGRARPGASDKPSTAPLHTAVSAPPTGAATSRAAVPRPLARTASQGGVMPRVWMPPLGAQRPGRKPTPEGQAEMSPRRCSPSRPGSMRGHKKRARRTRQTRAPKAKARAALLGTPRSDSFLTIAPARGKLASHQGTEKRHCPITAVGPPGS